MMMTTVAPPDLRRITEHDADFRHVKAQTVQALTHSLDELAHDLKHGVDVPTAQTAFVQRHTDILKNAYVRAHGEGQRDYWQGVSVTPLRWLRQDGTTQPAYDRMQRTMTFYAPSVAKMAQEAAARYAAPTVVRMDEPQLEQWLADIAVRVTLQADLTWSAFNDGYVDAGNADLAKPFLNLYWELEPMAKHCFPAGTAVATLQGPKPIEAICVGDLVQTLSGPRRVTRCYRSVFDGELVTVRASNHVTRCTPNHPFLTRRGWVEAAHLHGGDQVVLSQDGKHFLACHIRFPDAHDGIPTRTQVGILGAITTLLRQLSLRQLFETRMAMPVIPIGLDDERSNANIDNELCFDERRRLEINTDVGQNGAQSLLQFAGLVDLDLLMGDSQPCGNLRQLFRVRDVPMANLLLNFRSLHGIIDRHKFLRGVMNKTLTRFITKMKTQLIRFGGYCTFGIAQCLGNDYRAISRVVLSEIGDLLRRPFLIPATVASRQAFAGITDSADCNGTIADMPALWADLEFSGLLRGMGTESHRAITTDNPTEAPQSCSGPRLFKDLAALLADELHLDSTAPSVDVSSIQHGTVVYNLEVEDVHHYIADGFVVHNCDQCPAYAAGSPYQAPGTESIGGNVLDATPGDGHTDCGAACKCSLSYGPGPDAEIADWTGILPADMPLDAIWPELHGPIHVPFPDESTLTHAQKAALDRFRLAAIWWQRYQGTARNIPDLPELFNPENMDISFAQLTVDQQRILGNVLDAIKDWIAATGGTGEVS